MEQQDFQSTDQADFLTYEERITTNHLLGKQNEQLEKILHILYTQYQSPRHSFSHNKVMDLKMPFGSMLLLRLKWQMAGWVAFLIVTPLVGALLYFLVQSLGGLDLSLQLPDFILKNFQ